MEIMKQIRLFIVDELHLLAENDSVIEVITSRMRYISNQVEKPIRIIGAATSVANSRDIAEWIGASQNNTFNFHPNVRPVPLEIYIQGFDQPQRQIRLMAISKHIYQGVKQHSKGKPVIIFVSDRKQARITAVDLVAMAGADNQAKRFLTLTAEDLAPFINKISDLSLKHCLEHGVGFLYEGMNETERNVVERLFESGAIQMLISTYSLCWELTLTAYIVVIMDTLRYNGQERRYVDYSIPDMLQMMGRACRPEHDENAKCLVYCHTPKKDFYKKFLYEPLPVESTLNHSFNDHLNAEIVAKTIQNKQDCIDWITWTFFYRRLTQNPNFYNLQGVTGNIINDYLSELVENTVSELEASKCVAVDENEVDLAPLNLGMISSYYYIKYSTIDLFAKSLNGNFKLRQILEILCAATEFETVPIRHGEDKILRQLASDIKFKIEKPKFNEPDTKTNVLLQSHFTRIPLSSDFIYDQRIILEDVVKLIPALVDVISSNGWFKPALIAMQLSQMLVQAMWVDDSPLLQLPHFDSDRIRRCERAGIKDIGDLLNMEDEDRVKLLDMTEKELEDVANVCNKYPSVAMEYRVVDEEIVSGESAEIEVKLAREDEDYIDMVYAPYFPKEKEEYVWVVLGDYTKNKLYGLKRFRLPQSLSVNLKFVAPEEGEHELYLCLYSDSWIGCDQLMKFKIKVQPGEEGAEEDE
jgi:pre-mRNA-splicing helicase BRR2